MIAVVIPAHLAALYALLARPDRITYSTRTETVDTTRVINMPAAPIVASPVIAPAPEVRGCPAPNRKATNRVVPSMAHVDHVYASPTNVDWLVAWNEASIYSSTDGGRSFHEVLTGKGRVISAAIDCFGDVIAARGTEVGVRTLEGDESWRVVPGIDFTEAVFEHGYSQPAEVWLVGGGPDIVVVGFEKSTENKSRAATSRDLGRTWSFHDLSDGDFQGGHIATRQQPDGAVNLELEIQDCGGSWLETFTIENGTVTRGENASEEDEAAQAALRARLVKREPWRDVDASVDAAGRAWVIECGAPTLRTANASECSEGDAE